ncbi:DUF5305 domain-containing protein [Tissierella sp. Yu-01]|uniref:DUF5305 domain-containing protein n=1 Tax=Tissierella sp. Yu-01 TaxID=3035694 RepID=UPI00240D7C14|nr:DUF5305 domain-containing protein [Tissierella sp. Yu-01]WFA08268.1 DUF5305 domain-containing protein [Tissierella sp. Yu-01]
MKLKINKKLRLAIISILTILILLNTFLLFKEVRYPSFEQQKSKLYDYNNNGTVNYTIYLKPNKLYEGNSLGEGMLYITEFVDSINANFSYEFAGKGITQLEGTYNIIGKVKGFKEEREQIINIWEKDYELVKNKKFNTSNETYTLNENISINIEEYNTFVEEIIESSKINCDTSITLLMDINVTGTTDKGTFEENITPNIVIPLNTLMFEITTNNVEKPGAIEETIQVQLPVNKNQVIFYGVIIGICILGLIFLIFFTETAPKKDPLEKELNKILKKHGDRLVALNSDVELKDAKYVRTIDDLVRFADEVERPILYKYSEDYNEINIFYVANGDEVYVFDIEESLPKVEVEEISEEQIPSQ